MLELQDWVNRFGIKATCHYLGAAEEDNEYGQRGDMQHADIYAVTLVTTEGENGPHRAMHFPHFQQSVANSRSTLGLDAVLPTVLDLLYAAWSEALGIENNINFGQWASEYYSEGAESAEKWVQIQETYDAVVAQTARIKKLIGEDDWHDFLYETEGL